MRGQAVIGYFGKIPSHGDFVSRGLPPALVAAWDAWLQQCMLESQRQLGDEWLPLYLNSPVWRFAISPGILGAEGLGGVMMPSVDRVGRYFPLMVAAVGTAPLIDWLRKQSAWYGEVEEMAREALDPAFSQERFDAFAVPGTASGTLLPLTHDAKGGRSLWWIEASPGVDAALPGFDGMPKPASFAALLDGGWEAGACR